MLNILYTYYLQYILAYTQCCHIQAGKRRSLQFFYQNKHNTPESTGTIKGNTTACINLILENEQIQTQGLNKQGTMKGCR